MPKKKQPETKPKKNKGGRPRVVVDYDKLDKMCAIHCTGEECAALLEIDYEALNRAVKRDKNMSFKEYYAQKRAVAKCHCVEGSIQRQWMETQPC